MGLDPEDEQLQLAIVDSVGRALKYLAVQARDAGLASELAGEIPVLSTLIAATKDAMGVRDHLLVRRLRLFLDELNGHSANAESVEAFKLKCLGNPTYRQRVIVEILGMIDRLQADRKAGVLAHLFDAYINDALTWERFVELGFVLEQINTAVFDHLHRMCHGEGIVHTGRNREWEPMITACGIGSRHGSSFTLNSYGRDLYTHGLKPLYEASPSPDP